MKGPKEIKVRRSNRDVKPTVMTYQLTNMQNKKKLNRALESLWLAVIKTLLRTPASCSGSIDPQSKGSKVAMALHVEVE